MSNIYDLKDDPQPFIPVETVENQTPKSNRTLWIILIVILVMLILCCCCIVGLVVYGFSTYNFDWTMLENMQNNLVY